MDLPRRLSDRIKWLGREVSNGERTVLEEMARELEAELATMRRDGHAPPGKVLVDEGEFRELLERYLFSCDVCDGCILLKLGDCPVWKLRPDPDDIRDGDCRTALLSHFGLAEGDK